MTDDRPAADRGAIHIAWVIRANSWTRPTVAATPTITATAISN
ncbi:MAG: hypothetical protein ABSH51_31075 [Solirubrobacteraceae bacterium]